MKTKTDGEIDTEIGDSFKDEAEKWVLRPISPTIAAGKLIFWVSVLDALGSTPVIPYLVEVGLKTKSTMASESTTVN